MRGHLRKTISSLAIAAVLVVGSSTAAFAGFGGGIGDSPSPGGGGGGNHSGGGSGGGKGSGGGTSQPPKSNPVWTDWSLTIITTWGGSAQCGTDRNGQAAVGTRRTFEWRMLRDAEDANWTPLSQQIRNDSTACLYPPGWTDSGTETCIKTTNVQINLTAPNSKNLGSKTVSTAYAGNPTLANCRNSRTYLDLFVEPQEVGRYVFSGTQSRDRCTLRVFTAGYVNGALVTPAPTLVNCGAIPALRVNTVGEQTCKGWSDGNSGRTDWSSAECSNQNGGNSYQCKIGEPLINGLTARSQDILARGVNTNNKGSVINYGAVSVAGSAVTALGAPQTFVQRSGTPEIAQNSSRNTWMMDVRGTDGKSILTAGGANSGWRSGLLTQLDTVFYQASDYQNPSKFNTQWRWADSKVSVPSVTITGMDPVSFALRTQATTRQVTQTLVCKAPEASLTALRGSVDVQ